MPLSACSALSDDWTHRPIFFNEGPYRRCRNIFGFISASIPSSKSDLASCFSIVPCANSSARAAQPKREPGKKAIHIPDAQILTPDDQTIAVEVELSPKSNQEMDAILQELVQGNEVSPLPYAAAWYFVSHASKENVTARRAVESARLRLPEELQERVQIIELEDIIT